MSFLCHVLLTFANSYHDDKLVPRGLCVCVCVNVSVSFYRPRAEEADRGSGWIWLHSLILRAKVSLKATHTQTNAKYVDDKPE